MKLTTLARLDRGARRVRGILAVLARHGLADWLHHTNVRWLKRLVGRGNRELAERPREQRVRLALTELGPTFIKLGQTLSMRPDVVGRAVADELAELQDHCPADPPETVMRAVERELGRPPRELFAEFDPEPIASASIAQVHAARLLTGEEVVLKIQHEGIQQRIETDLDLLAGLAELAEQHAPGLAELRPVATTRELRRSLMRELDFVRERENLTRFRRSFRTDERVRIPRPYREFSNRRILTMERLRGVPVADDDALAGSSEDLDAFARRGAEMYLDMIFRDGFYHADPHAGNVLVLPGGAVGVLDCGMVGYIDEDLREDIETILLAILQEDARELADVVVRIGSVPPHVDRAALRRELGEFVGDHMGRSVEEIEVTGTVNGVFDITHRYRVLLPSSLAMLLRVLVMLEGLARRLSATFQLTEVLEVYARKAVRRRTSARTMLRRVRRTQRDWWRLMSTLPADAYEILRGLRDGGFELHLEHRRLESTVNRLVQGLLCAALFVGSAMILSTQVPPTLGGTSVPGLLGCALAIVLLVRLWLAIRRSDRELR